jgi:KipI family sensor histidine kinase inhibitor
MRVLPSGTTAVLVEVDHLDQVLELYAALADAPPVGVVDVVPAARTVLVVIDPAVTTLSAVSRAVLDTPPKQQGAQSGGLVQIPVSYDGEDLEEAARLLGGDVAGLIRRHTGAQWTVAFSGFAPGFAYLTSPSWREQLPRRATPRTSVPGGAVGLAGQFSGVYPRPSPGGWQLIGRTELAMFDVAREPPALLPPGARVRFVDAARS